MKNILKKKLLQNILSHNIHSENAKARSKLIRGLDLFHARKKHKKFISLFMVLKNQFYGVFTVQHVLLFKCYDFIEKLTFLIQTYCLISKITISKKVGFYTYFILFLVIQVQRFSFYFFCTLC